ncbi:CHAT domain-containing protein [Parapedobacter sp. 2B3]|uniref:CHAT domain-containing protein n=1 Tax=Parapedobacter sp. 2B3 TaxID=3342381 RepID=UPI0035B5C5D7
MKKQTCHLLGMLLCLLQTFSLLAQPGDYDRSLEAYRNQQYDSASWYLQRAVKVFRQADQHDSLVWAYVHKAEILWATAGNWPALRTADTAVRLSERLPKPYLARVAALNKKGQILVHVSHVAEGQANLLQAERSIPAGDTLNGTVAALYNNLSWMYMVRLRLDDALRYAKRSLGIQKVLYGDDARQLLGVYQTLGLIASDAGRLDEAERYSLELYRLARLHLPPTHPNMALVHNQLAIIYEEACRYTEALHHLRAMVNVAQQEYAETGNPQFLAMSYNNTALLYHQLGEHSLAASYYEKALHLHRINYGDEEAGIVQPLAHLADVKRVLGEYGTADSLFRRAYRIQQAYAKENVLEAANLESQMGDLRYDVGDFAAAETWYERALMKYRHSGIDGGTMVTETKSTLGKTLVAQGRVEEAQRMHREVLREYRRRYPRGNILVAGKLNDISEAYCTADALEEAIRYSDSTFMELLGVSHLPDSNWVVALPFSHHVIRYLNNRVTILEQQYRRTQQEDALETIIRIAHEYGAYLELGIAALRTQSALIQLANSQKKLYQKALNAAWLLSEKHGRPAYLATAFEVAEMGKGLLLRLAANNLMVDEQLPDNGGGFSLDRQWRSRIGALNARYLNTGGVDDSLLTELTEAMEGYRGFQDSMRSIADPRWSTRFDLQPRGVEDIRRTLLTKGETLLEYAVTEHHIYAFVISASVFEAFRFPRSPIAEKVIVLRNLQSLDITSFVDAAYPLYQQLIAPLEPLVAGQQLLIIPDAELFGVNFEILLSDEGGMTFSELAYLVRRYEITYLLSASSAVQQLQHKPNVARRGLFMVPGFTDRMKQRYGERQPDSLAEGAIHARLLRQPFSLQAARDALRFVKGDLYVEEAADEQRFRTVAGGYHMLHMGTHAEVDNMSPLQSRLFLAGPVVGDSVSDDGILHAYEVYSMQLRAELAVLSACNTGAGKFQAGEGVISLAHSFLYAGCSSVLMSLWDIDEKTSASITTGFYANLADGMRKSEALRATKLSYLADVPQELAHPYYWAGLGLIGNNAPIYAAFGWRNWLTGLVLAAVLIAGWGYFRYAKARRGE